MLNKNQKDGARVSQKAEGCTFSTEPWWNEKYCFWDTAGLNEQENGIMNHVVATINLIKFITDSKGFHGAIMVVSEKSINSQATLVNWKLFYETFLNQRIPIVICITGRGFETADEDEKWIMDQENYFETYFKSKYGKSPKLVVYSREIEEINNKVLKEEYCLLRDKSRTKISTTLQDIVGVTYFYHIEGKTTRWDVFKRMWNGLIEALGMNDKKWKMDVPENVKDKLMKVGFSKVDALKIAKQLAD